MYFFRGTSLADTLFHFFAVACVVSGVVFRPMCSGWLGAAKAAGVEKVDVTPAMGLLLSVKDSIELDNIKRAAILTNKVRLSLLLLRTC